MIKDARDTRPDCDHKRTHCDSIYEGCLDCGAVKLKNEPASMWHSCDKCRYLGVGTRTQ